MERWKALLMYISLGKGHNVDCKSTGLSLSAALPHWGFTADIFGASEEHSVLLWDVGGRAVEGAANVHQSRQGAQRGLQEHSCECPHPLLCIVAPATLS